MKIRTEDGKLSVKNIVGRRTLRIIRAVLAVIIFISIANRCIYPWNSDVPPLFYFTVQSNLLCALYWLWSAFFPDKRNPKITLAITTYIAITGVIFVVFLDYGFTETIYTKLGHNEISDVVHYYSMIGSIITHYAVPFLAVIDYLLFTEEGGSKPTFKTMLYPLAHSIFAVLFTLFTEKYIYPFYNPEAAGGLPVVLLIAAVIFLIFYFVNRGLFRLNSVVQYKADRYYKKLLSGESEQQKNTAQ